MQADRVSKLVLDPTEPDVRVGAVHLTENSRTILDLVSADSPRQIFTAVVNAFPVEGALLGNDVGSSQMPRPVVSDKTIFIESIGILGLLDTVVESASNDGIRNSAIRS